MTMTKCRWRGPGGRVGLLVLTAALIPLPVAASEAAPAQTTSTVKTSLHEAVAREAVKAAKAPIARTTERRADKGSADKGTMAFFKTGPGIAVLAVMAVGTGYAIYSANHDKITSAGRK